MSQVICLFLLCRLINIFGCENDKWLNDLYNLRDKWCSDFRNDFSFGGILSSQRRKTTNNAISRGFQKCLHCAIFTEYFLKLFLNGRSNENIEDFHYNQGCVEIVLPDSKLLQHANGVYNIGAYMLFERQFMRFLEYSQGLVVSNNGKHVYEIWHPDITRFRHTVVMSIY